MVYNKSTGRYEGRVFRLSNFRVQFIDQELMEIDDIITFENEQVAEIKKIARKFTKVHIRQVEKYGFDLTELYDRQKLSIISTKNEFFKNKTDENLLDEGSVLVTLHSSERSLKRTGSNKQPDFVSLIGRLRKVDKVIKAQFKGYPTLSYTTTDQNSSDAYKLPISFIKGKRGHRVIKLITVVPETRNKAETIETSIMESNPGVAEMFEKLKQNLKKE